MAVLGTYYFDVTVVGGRYPDEIHHRIVWYDERRILFIFCCHKVIVIITEKMKIGRMFYAVFYGFGACVNKEHVGKIRLDDKLSLAIHILKGTVEWEKCFDTMIDEVIIGFQFAVVSGTQYKPFLLGSGAYLTDTPSSDSLEETLAVRPTF